MIKRTIEISSGPARLSIHHHQLVIEREKLPPTTIPTEDIGVLLVDHPAVSYTHAVFTTLAENGTAIVLCGHAHTPSSMLLPVETNSVQTERFRHQIEASIPTRKRLWRQIVARKLLQQAVVLESLAGSDVGLRQLASRVRSDDVGNREAQGAQRYWPRLFGADFRRSREGPPPNNLLNYGYMALRAATARALCGAGLLPTLGLHHRNRYNAFCLADDVMEPYRPFVDLAVVGLAKGSPPALNLGRDEKALILGILNWTVTIRGRKTPLLLALHATAASLCRAFSGSKEDLALPEGLPSLDEEQIEATTSGDISGV